MNVMAEAQLVVPQYPCPFGTCSVSTCKLRVCLGVLCRDTAKVELLPGCAQVWGMTLVAFLIGLPMLKSEVAFNAVASISVIGLYITYGLVIFFKIFLGRR